MTTYGTRAHPDDRPLPGAPFGESVRRYFVRWRTFSGRASRAEFWNASLLQVVVVGGLYLLTGLLERSEPAPGAFVALYAALVLWVLGTALPTIALNARRLHDINLSGWWQLVALVPYVGWAFLPVVGLVPPDVDGDRFDEWEPEWDG